MTRKFLLTAVVAIGWLACAAGAAEAPAAMRVVLLANRADPDSVRIAEHYAEKRGVPRENIIALEMPLTETISWSEFVTTVWQPLQAELVRRDWIDAIAMSLTDDVGRTKYAIGGHRISYLVTCRGVPLRIAHDPDRFTPRAAPYDHAELRTNAGAVDSELSLLAQTNYPINGFTPNLLYRNDQPSTWEEAQVVKVSRLDGPTAASAMALVDHALEAERTGLLGRAYVDMGGVHPTGDRWLEATAAQIKELGFDLDVDRSPRTLPLAARFDAPVLYFGWYAEGITGPFLVPGFTFPPGAIAVHIHSFSAETLHSGTSRWCGPFVERGVTATVGNVFEPYLDYLHHPDLLMRALARGDTFGDAAYYALPVLSWQSIAIGDPLYRPFARSIDEQWKDRASLPAAWAGYAALREMHLLEAQNQPAEAIAAAKEVMREHPNLALGFALARESETSGDIPGATRELTRAGLTPLRPDEWILAHQAALLLQRFGAFTVNDQLEAPLLTDPALPSEWRTAWTSEAAHAREAAAGAKK